LHSGSHPHTGSHSHTPLHHHYACVAARILPRSYTRTSTPHTPGHSRRGQSHRGLALPQGVPGSLYPPSFVCTHSQHSSPQPRKARPNPPGRDQLQGRIASPSVPEGGYPAARTGSPHTLRVHPHCPPLPPCVCSSLTPSVPCSLFPIVPISRVSVISVTSRLVSLVHVSVTPFSFSISVTVTDSVTFTLLAQHVSRITLSSPASTAGLTAAAPPPPPARSFQPVASPF